MNLEGLWRILSTPNKRDIFNIMIQVESANIYFLKPIEAIDPDYDPLQDYTQEQLDTYPDLIDDNALVVGSKYIMNEVAVYMNQDDVIVTTGLEEERCVIITDLSRARCKEIIALGKKAYDKKLQKALKENAQS